MTAKNKVSIADIDITETSVQTFYDDMYVDLIKNHHYLEHLYERRNYYLKSYHRAVQNKCYTTNHLKNVLEIDKEIQYCKELIKIYKLKDDAHESIN